MFYLQLSVYPAIFLNYTQPHPRLSFGDFHFDYQIHQNWIIFQGDSAFLKVFGVSHFKSSPTNWCLVSNTGHPMIREDFCQNFLTFLLDAFITLYSLFT